MRRLVIAALSLISILGFVLAGDDAEVITSVDMQSIVAHSFLKDLKLEKSEMGDHPGRHLYYFSSEVFVAISVHPTKAEANTFLHHVWESTSIGGVPVANLGDDATQIEDRRYDFRLNNVVVSVMGSRAIAESIAMALKADSPRGKAIQAFGAVSLDVPGIAKPGERLQFTVKLKNVKDPHAIRFWGEHRVTEVASWKNEDTWFYALEQDMPSGKGPCRLELEILAPGNIVVMRTVTIEVK